MRNKRQLQGGVVMKRLIKFLALVVGFSLATSGLALADNPTSIPIDVNIGELGEASLDVAVRNITGDAVAGVSFNLDGLDPNDKTKFWKVSDQYLDVRYSVSWNAIWGVRIYTDNTGAGGWPDMAAKLTNPNEDVDNDGDPWNDGDEAVTYGGLIYTNDLTKVIFRASLGWQVRIDKVAKPLAPIDDQFDNGTTFDYSDDYDMDWAYIMDKNDNNPVEPIDFNQIDTGYIDENGNGTQDKDEPYTYNPHVVAYGWIGQGLAQHPHMPDVNGDGKWDPKKANDAYVDDNYDYDIAVYLAARFVSTDYWADPAGLNFVLPTGNYSAKMYVDLIHE